MFAKLFSFNSLKAHQGQKGREHHMPMSDLISLFTTAYQHLETPLALCEGLEIIAYNDALLHLLASGGILAPLKKPDGLLLNTIIPEQRQIELLFSNSPTQTMALVGGRTINLTARDWSYNRHLKILEWHDQTYISDLQQRLSRARHTDPATGTLLPGAFKKQARLLLANTPHALTAVVRITETAHTRAPICDERLAESLLRLAEALRHELDEATLIGRPNSASLCLFTPLDGEEGEQKHILRQIARVSRLIVSDHTVRIGASGFPESAKTFDGLYDEAMLALNCTDQRQTMQLFDRSIAQAETKREQLKLEMEDALERNEITPFFQPVISAQSRQIRGFEALIRWFHPTLGFVSPPDIIELARQTGLLHALTGHVLKQAVQQMKLWPEPIQFAVNVTPSQLTSDLVDLVRGIVRGANIDPSRLEIEVTEDALIDDFDASAHIFARLRAIGVSVAMDDFGAGYTSMSNLRSLDFNKIKIDKSISDGLPNDKKSIAIVKSLMFMAGELNVEVTIEGIETEEQLALLHAFDCGVQGYVFAKPMPTKDLDAMKKFLAPSTSPVRETAVVGFGPRSKTNIG